MPFRIILTEPAADDLENIFDYIFVNDSPEKAVFVLNQINETLKDLADFPERGNYPQELSQLGIYDFREVFFKPYRIVYEVIDDKVYISVIADGRRDMQTLLTKRLLK